MLQIFGDNSYRIGWLTLPVCTGRNPLTGDQLPTYYAGYRSDSLVYPWAVPDSESGTYAPSKPTLSYLGLPLKEQKYDFAKDMYYSFGNGGYRALYLLSHPHRHLSSSDWDRVQADTNLFASSAFGEVFDKKGDWVSEVGYHSSGVTCALFSSQLEGADLSPNPYWKPQGNYNTSVRKHLWSTPEVLEKVRDEIPWNLPWEDNWLAHIYEFFEFNQFSVTSLNTSWMRSRREQGKIIVTVYAVSSLPTGLLPRQRRWGFSECTYTIEPLKFEAMNKIVDLKVTVAEEIWDTIGYFDDPAVTKRETWNCTDRREYDFYTELPYYSPNATSTFSERSQDLIEAALEIPIGAFPQTLDLEDNLLDQADVANVELFETAYETIGMIAELVGFVVDLIVYKKVKLSHIKTENEFFVIRSRLKRLRKGLADGIFGTFNFQLLKKFRKDPTTVASDVFLTWKFGIAPTLREIQALKETLLIQGATSKRAYRASQTTDYVYGDQEWRQTMRVQCVIAPHLEPLHNALRAVDRLGLLPTLERVWAIVPWSFLINWIVPVSKNFARFDQVFIRCKLWDLYYRCSSQTLTREWKHPRFEGVVILKHYRRETSLNWSTARQDIKTMLLNKGRLPILLALIAQKFR